MNKIVKEDNIELSVDKFKELISILDKSNKSEQKAIIFKCCI